MTIDAPLPSQIPDLRNLWKEAFGDTDDYLDTFFHTAFSPERCRCLTVDNQIAAALYWFDCSCRGQNIAYLYAVATAKAYRGRGFCRELMADTHRYLLRRGYTGVILVPGSASLFAFYERMGYSTCSRIGEIRCTAAAEPIPLQRIGKEAFAALRRKRLPVGGVIQEGENLDFLLTQAELYAGDGFIFAASHEDNTVHASEFLGDISALPGIVCALDCTEGIFRIPGEDRPFAMYYPLGEHHGEPPAYFGFAFD